MSFAHVDSVDALKQLVIALWKFTEAANHASSEAEADVQRTQSWLEMDARVYWQGQIKKRTLSLNQAKESLRSKQSISRKDGTKPSAIEELKAVDKAKAHLEQALEKLEKVKQYAKLFNREALQYRGLMQRFVNAVQVGVPDAASHLEGLITSLEQYTAPVEVASSAVSEAQSDQGPSMKRAEPTDSVGPAPIKKENPEAQAKPHQNQNPIPQASIPTNPGLLRGGERMGVQDASGQLEKAMRQLIVTWNQAKESWSDIKMTGFEERYMDTLQQDVRIGIETMARMGTVIDQIRRACMDRDMI